ncbi:hypothetical protein SSPIM334S_05978 [Streptomyces spiroverticillatus]
MVTVWVAVSMTVATPSTSEVTYRRVPLGVTARALGLPVGMVAVTALVAVSITETELPPLLAT